MGRTKKKVSLHTPHSTFDIDIISGCLTIIIFLAISRSIQEYFPQNHFFFSTYEPLWDKLILWK